MRRIVLVVDQKGNVEVRQGLLDMVVYVARSYQEADAIIEGDRIMREDTRLSRKEDR